MLHGFLIYYKSSDVCEGLPSTLEKVKKKSTSDLKLKSETALLTVGIPLQLQSVWVMQVHRKTKKETVEACYDTANVCLRRLQILCVN